MIRDEQLIQGCKEHNPHAQKALYDKYAPVMRCICIRYSGDYIEAKDILQDGFMKVFMKIDTYTGNGSFEGWIKRIMINTAIKHYHKKRRIQSFEIDDVHQHALKDMPDEEQLNYKEGGYDLVSHADFTREELMDSLKILPDSYRIVFNLFVIEGRSHKEISESLKIEEKTSRSRLFRARNIVKEHLRTLSIEKLKNEV
jgi:RNA polymerase sigma-70 factor (ECF subfamily)